MVNQMFQVETGLRYRMIFIKTLRYIQIFGTSNLSGRDRSKVQTGLRYKQIQYQRYTDQRYKKVSGTDMATVGISCTTVGISYTVHMYLCIVGNGHILVTIFVVQGGKVPPPTYLLQESPILAK